MSKKVYDIVATVGEYLDGQNQTKKKYLNVGAVLKGDNGSYILLNKTFNPAGLAEQGKDSIILSLFEPKPRDQVQSAQQAAPSAPSSEFSDAIPF